MNQKLAIDGGTPVRTRPFPERKLFDAEDERQLREVLEQNCAFFPLGTKVHEFEHRWAQLYGVSHAVCSTSGTSAIHVALGAINPEPGMEVITTAFSDMGTVAPIVQVGCVPVFADVELGTFNLDPDDIERKITDRTAAIIVVHCFGQPADMERILPLARARGIPVIEDCAQAHLTRYKGQLAGTIGDLGTFSFQDSKHLQCGDGGCTITNDDDLGRRATVYVDKGCDWTPDREYRLRYAFIAPCYRMTEFQGAVLLAQLQRLPWIVAQRQRLGDMFCQGIAGLPGIHPPQRTDGVEHSYWTVPFRVEEQVLGVSPTRFREALAAEGIPIAGAWIGQPLYAFEALRDRQAFGTSDFPFDYGRGAPIEYPDGLCPNLELGIRQLCTLRIHEHFTDDDVRDCIQAVCKVAQALSGNA